MCVTTKLNGERKNKGITLIALVITIIVLLILAAMSIATLTGDNRILNKAKTAEEKVKLMLADYMTEKYTGTTRRL